jgi:hypothetical protein
VRCGESKKCTVVLDGFTSIIDLAFGPDGRINVAQIDDASWLAMEIGAGVGGLSTRNPTDDLASECDELSTACRSDVDHVSGSCARIDPRSFPVVPTSSAEPVALRAGAGSNAIRPRVGSPPWRK